MSQPWWGREAGPSRQAAMVPSSGVARTQPELLPAGRAAVSAEIFERRAAFTPEWSDRRPTDAGVALVRLFGEQMEPILHRLNRLPEKALVEYLRVAGIQLLPATPAEVLLEVKVSEAATQSAH